MKIERYVQGKDDKEIFCNVGSWLTSKSVHDQLGMAITSQENDIWYIVSLNDVVIGFALVRAMKSTNALHIRFIYTDTNTKKVLIKKIIEDAKKDGIKSIWTNDREKEAVWKSLKFSFTKRARGEFGRWEKEIVNKDKKTRS